MSISPILSTIPLILSLASCSLLFDEGSTQSQSDGGNPADGAIGQADGPMSNDASPTTDGQASADATTEACAANEVDCDQSVNTDCQSACVTPFDINGFYTAELGCNTLTIAAWGAGGGSGMSYIDSNLVLNMRAASGGYVYTDYALSGAGPHQFSVFVGTAGGDAGPNTTPFIAGAPGLPGGGSGGTGNGTLSSGGGGGGGFSGVFRGNSTLSTSGVDVIAVAGGGGGSGGNTAVLNRILAGAGGGLTGQNGGNPNFPNTISLGGGMMENTTGTLVGSNGANRVSTTGNGGGGGGGGYQGGEGGRANISAGTGGAGGSGFVRADTSNTTLVQGDNDLLIRPNSIGIPGQPGRVVLTCKP